ncbi:TIGR01906 family membrane protein [Clostridium cochlearium]|uniref:TIGR01906 family membrane protein n=1 Tax=Clostridium cochlearium TaxID=1494 RepID=UPI000B948E84|nr:TIGR01906 family membrane protein [Clostridium cochlearium]MCG4571029.1 TIGR01906 family membrane protein [Clostridium cochlearium]MCR1970991.1 TIGR01906 family membrane protein [Clostridium cochlearium]MDU1442687.1 TIGR01906 family membrane protein [Clostridium cochlearium]SNV87851.1 membrane spanning protein [Clostridium cochlearium]STA93597.1 membrane spanning protein [Clostridium cochlearium]
MNNIKPNKILFSLILSLFFILLSIEILVNFKYLYYFDIKFLNLESSSNLSYSEIKSNYDYIIKFITSTKNMDFNIPSFTSSSEGTVHFYEVKNIFYNIKLLLYITGIISIFIIYYSFKHNNFIVFHYSFYILFSVPIVLMITFLLDFNKAFTYFHKIFFNNDFWLFDINKDPIINILPERFFLHMAIFLNILIIVFAVICKKIYKKSSRPI